MLIGEGTSTPKYARITLNSPNYQSPAIKSVTAERDSNNVVTVTVTTELSMGLTDRDIVILDEDSQQVGTDTTTSDLSTIVLNGTYPPFQVYKFTCVVNDDYTSSSIGFILPTEEPWLSAAADHKGTGIGCVAEGADPITGEGQFEVAWNTKFYREVSFTPEIISSGLITNLSGGLINYAVQKRVGNIVTLYISLANVATTAGGSDFATAKFNGAIPPYDVEAIGYYGQSACAVRLCGTNTSSDKSPGDIIFRNASSTSQSLNAIGIRMNLTYIV